MSKIKFLVSGYSSDGINKILEFDTKSFSNKFISSFEVENASFLSCYKDFIFAISEMSNKGQIFLLKKSKSKYNIIDVINTKARELCYIRYLPKRKLIVACGYKNGVIVLVKVENERFTKFEEYNLNINKENQSKAHCAVADISENYIFITDIANDSLVRFDIEDMNLKSKNVLELSFKSGPRHLVINEKKDLIYLLTEYSNEIYVISNLKRNMRICKKIEVVKDSCISKNYSSSIQISKDSKYLYVAIRGINAINIYRILENGELKFINRKSCYGNWPRHIAIINNQYLLVANRKSNKVIGFFRDELTGLLSEKKFELEFDSPSFVCRY